MKKLIILSTILFMNSTMAQYRVYQYYVSSKLKLPTDSKSYLVTSTLDPVSYISYHGGNHSIKVDLLRTWKCPGHTGGNTPVCKSPLENATTMLNENQK
jgi:hypothetical protein